MTAFSESDFNGKAVSKKPTSSGFYSEGLFQQTLPWWTNDHFDPVEATKAFLREFRKRSGVPVQDCWDVQRWAAPDWRSNLNDFLFSKETINYTNRLETVKKIIETGVLPDAS